MAAPQGRSRGGPVGQPDRAPQGHVRVRVRPEEDGVLPARRAGPQAHLRRLPGAAAALHHALGARLRSGLQPVDPRPPARAPAPRRRRAAGRHLRVHQGRHRLAGDLRRAGLPLLPRHQARGADDPLGGGHAHPRHHHHHDGRRHGLRRRLDRPLAALDGSDLHLRRGGDLRAHPRAHRSVRRPRHCGGGRLPPLPQPRRLAGGDPPRRRRPGEPGDPRHGRLLDARHAGAGLRQHPPALQALPHHHRHPQRLRPRPHPARPPPLHGQLGEDRRDGDGGLRGAGEGGSCRPRPHRGLHLEGDPRLLHLHRVRPLLRQLPGPQDRQDPEPQAAHARPARSPLRSRERVHQPPRRAQGCRRRRARSRSWGRARSRRARPRRARPRRARPRRPRSRRPRPPRAGVPGQPHPGPHGDRRRRWISSPTSSTPTCSGPAPPAAPARSSAR